MLTQAQTIRALADALEWFEKELGWGVPPASLPHLTGRIGELYVAVQTRGQMAGKTNQPGYDVVSADGERISVKTITSSTHVTFNPKNFSEVDRVIVLRINVDETEPSIEELFDCPAAEIAQKFRKQGSKLSLAISSSSRQPQDLSKLRITAAVQYGDVEIRQYENGSIAVTEDGSDVSVVKPVLRRIAREVGISLLNGSGNPKNTRSLGSDVISTLGGQDDSVRASPAEPRAAGSSASEKDSLARSMEACLLGGAIGDALGAEMEFWSLDEIRRRFPDGIRDLPPHDGLRGAITDDTQMTLFTAEGLIRAMVRHASKGICHMPSVVHHALLRWLKTQGQTAPALVNASQGGKPVGLALDQRLQKRRAPGLTCLNALSSAKAFGEEARNDSKGCGTIKRIAPLAFIEPSLISEYAQECSALTHGHTTGQQAAAAWALILHGLLSGEDIDQAAQRQLGTFNAEVERAMDRALTAPRDRRPETVATLGEGWVAEEALSIALYACLASSDLESGLLTAVTHGGDSDSTGAIAGNALGLIYTDQVFRHRWAEQVECRDLITQLSQDFAEATFGDAETLWERYPGW